MIKSIFHTSLAFLIFSMAACGGESTEEVDEEVVNENYCDCRELFFDEPYNRFYIEDRKKPFTGKCEEFHPNGELKMEKNFEEGKVHGDMITYFDNGQKQDVRFFDNNFQTGEQISYNRKGDVVYHAIYKRGKLEEVLLTKPDLSEDE